MLTNNNVAIYVRLSKEDDDLEYKNESESILNQKNILTKYAVEHNWTIYNIYSDEDYSGADDSRPAFNQMLKDASEHKFQIVLCKSQSRFSRNMATVETYIHDKFLEWGIRFISVVDNADTAVKGNKKARQINGLINEWYLEDTSDNIRSVFYSKMVDGQYLSTFPPYGYLKDPDKKNHLVKNPDTSKVVKQIYNWYLEGNGLFKIAQKLNEQNIPNPRKQQELMGLRKTKKYAENENGIWNFDTIGDILHNRAYCGDTVQHTREKVSYKNKHIRRVPESQWIIVANTHEAIIEREVFDRVQAIMKKRRRTDGLVMHNMLCGQIFCAKCGRAMTKTYSRTTKGQINYFRCRSKYVLKKEEQCKLGYIREDIILSAIQNTLIDKLGGIDKICNSAEIDKIISDAAANRHNKISGVNGEFNRLSKEIDKCTNDIKTLYLDKIEGIITAEQFIEYNQEFIAKKKYYLEQIERIKKEKETEEKNICYEQKIKSMIRDFLKTDELTQNIINILVNRITFGKQDKATGKPILEIKWAWENS